MKRFQDFLNETDWFGLLVQIGLGLWCLIALVRCALKD